MRKFTVMAVAHRKHQYGHDWFLLREQGQPAINFVHFLTPTWVTVGGTEVLVAEDSCIIYLPGCRQEFRTHNGHFCNNFLTFQVNDPDFIARFNLPENEVFAIYNGEEITAQIEWLAYAVPNKLESFDDEININIVKLFETLSQLHIGGNPNLKRKQETKQRFIALRDEMRNDPSNWTIERMAHNVWLTRSRFTVLYGEFFGVSPNADLMNMRVEFAKKMLTTTDASIAEVARACGYSGVEYFIRLFGERTKKTPSRYRRDMRDNM